MRARRATRSIPSDWPAFIQDVASDAEWADHMREKRLSLRIIAESTGGLAVFDAGELEAAMTRIVGRR